MLPTPKFSNLDFDKVYEPAEDTFLLLDCFEGQIQYLNTQFGPGSTPVITEIGTGSGVVTTFVCQHVFPYGIVLSTDINPHACLAFMDTVTENSIANPTVDTLQMSLTSGIRPNAIDVLIFNPPYVPAEEVPQIPESLQDSKWLDLALSGGEDGMEVTWILLHQLDHILSKKVGIAYILFCARNKPEEVANYMRQQGWIVDVVIHRKAGWEVLSILRFKRNES